MSNQNLINEDNKENAEQRKNDAKNIHKIISIIYIGVILLSSLVYGFTVLFATLLTLASIVVSRRLINNNNIQTGYRVLFSPLFVTILLLLKSSLGSTSLNNPAPIGKATKVEHGNISLTILDVIRPANIEVEENIPSIPISRIEYSIIELRIKCFVFGSCIFYTKDLNYYDNQYAQFETFVTTKDSLQPIVYLSPGQTLEGYIVLRTLKNDKGDVLVYSSYLESAKYFSVR